MRSATRAAQRPPGRRRPARRGGPARRRPGESGRPVARSQARTVSPWLARATASTGTAGLGDRAPAGRRGRSRTAPPGPARPRRRRGSAACTATSASDRTRPAARRRRSPWCRTCPGRWRGRGSPCPRPGRRVVLGVDHAHEAHSRPCAPRSLGGRGHRPEVADLRSSTVTPPTARAPCGARAGPQREHGWRTAADTLGDDRGGMTTQAAATNAADAAAPPVADADPRPLLHPRLARLDPLARREPPARLDALDRRSQGRHHGSHGSRCRALAGAIGTCLAITFAAHALETETAPPGHEPSATPGPSAPAAAGPWRL